MENVRIARCINFNLEKVFLYNFTLYYITLKCYVALCFMPYCYIHAAKMLKADVRLMLLP